MAVERLEPAESLTATVAAFAERYPVFTQGELNNHLGVDYPVSQTSELIRVAIDAHEQQRRTVYLYAQAGTQAEPPLYAADFIPETPVRLPKAPKKLRPLVEAEVQAVFADRPSLSQAALLFYLRTVQGAGKEAPIFLGVLVRDGFIEVLPGKRFCLPSSGLEARRLGRAFSDKERALALLALKYLDAEGRQHRNVFASELMVRIVGPQTVTPREAAGIIQDLVLRGCVIADEFDSKNPQLMLKSKLLQGASDAERLSELLDIVDALALDPRPMPKM